ATPLLACKGRVLHLAVGNSVDQAIMGQMLSILINERTGTTVEIVPLDDIEAAHEAVLNGLAEIYINYIGMAHSGTEGPNAVDEPQKAYILASRSYNEKYDMIWLKPFGFKGPMAQAAPSGKVDRTMAAPITTKEVVKKFPILDRLINKLAGRVDNKALEELREKSENQDVEITVREFLTSHKLI
ncbi:MAG: glycine betaine ABC transporter substrate-binding protein, partial [Thermodesulfobacteriota bacterium]